ncbi:MAG: hypothetical protein V3R36_03555 [Dehalococcoidales bacterium]
MKFLALKSRITVPQAISWAIVLIILVNIYIDGAFQTWAIYQKSLDFVDFSFRLVKSWIMHMM